MGWLFGHYTRKDLADHLINGNGVKTIKHFWAGNNLWAVQENSKGQRFIALYLCRGTPKVTDDPHNWGYKDLDETCGPSETSCPASYLELVPDPQIGYSTEWRKRVLDRAERGRRQLVPGQKIKLYGKEYTVQDKRPNRMGYTIVSPHHSVFRLKTSQVRHVEVLP